MCLNIYLLILTWYTCAEFWLQVVQLLLKLSRSRERVSRHDTPSIAIAVIASASCTNYQGTLYQV